MCTNFSIHLYTTIFSGLDLNDSTFMTFLLNFLFVLELFGTLLQLGGLYVRQSQGFLSFPCLIRFTTVIICP